MQHIDGSEISVGIDLDQGARIASLQWRDLQVAVPFRGTPVSWGWYAMAPWAGRIRDGIILDSKGEEKTLPTTWMPPNAIHGYGFHSSWEETGHGRARLVLPEPYGGAVISQSIEVLDDAVRWILEYEANGCDLPAWLGFHPWFPRELSRGGEAEIEFSAKKMLIRGDDGLPDGRLISLAECPPKNNGIAQHNTARATHRPDRSVLSTRARWKTCQISRNSVWPALGQDRVCSDFSFGFGYSGSVRGLFYPGV